MRIGIFPTSATACAAGAQMIIDRFAASPGAVLGVATGSTPLELYAELRTAKAQGRFTLAHSRAFALDEYVGIAPDHPEAYRNVLRAELVGEDKTGLAEKDLVTPDGQHPDPEAAAKAYDTAIREVGGIDLQILGIGSDGHIAFNEPGSSLVSRTHHEALAAQTITDNARFFGNDLSQVPTSALTQGLGTIMEAREIMLLAFGSGKSAAVRELIEGPISQRWPATILQMHPLVTVLLDEAAASDLELTDLYRARWNLSQRA
ncbi:MULTISPECIES: glucosamine-6-phosphate deaminase [unclassified Actinobaculum]|uniref:glucosamine-6-phosphate deaminase n=1 Tax=unclassified Actinobaculum TaxID=2609299 RepID=UPI000D52607E|nr:MULTISPECIES: glucosamine-6-phosphate deaminase [unclassified Actinobaculum]AWE41852.1 glucosamine-6-phosphate deaminase [Actinobaculum sp. 313]RTE50231.1 glucosamine-6-phosphate deaminase [Actinobaculum sp. 352]